MQTKGWIKFWRRIEEDELWFQEPFTRAQAWVDLLIIANHDVGYFYVRGNKVKVGRGQIGRSEDTLALRWQWSRGKVRRFISELKKQEKIEQQKNNILSLITIINYDRYQNNDTTDSTTDGQQTVQQTDTNKNVKNVKNVNTAPYGAVAIKGETHMLEELEYIPEDQPVRTKKKYGKLTMAVLAKCYLEAAHIEIESGETYDANKIAKGLSKIYNECVRDADKTMARIREAGAYFESKGLSWTPEAVWRDWELIKKWKQGANHGQDVSERRIL